MKVYKEKQFLIFDFENGKTVKYDFATNQTIGIKGGIVKNLKSQLSGFEIKDLFECCVDKNYCNFLKFVRDRYSNCSGYDIYNIGTILEKTRMYSNFEQIFSAGIENVVNLRDFNLTINDIPKSLIKLANNHKITISNDIVKFYKEYINEHYLAYNLEYISLNDDNIREMLYTTKEFRNGVNEHGWTIYKNESLFNLLIRDYGYSAKALCLYIDELVTLEAIDSVNYLMKELYDYARMMKQISEKFDKYPRNFLTTHKIACRNYNRMKKEFSEDLFKKRINKDYEFTYKNYTFIYPNSTQEIKDEATQQNNCVASYIDRVIDGECDILFMRDKDDLDKSLVTIEVRNNRIVQARGKFNRMVTKEEQEVIDKWNNKYNKNNEREVA